MRRLVLFGLVMALLWGASALAAPPENREQQTVPRLQDLTRPQVDWLSLDPPVIVTSEHDVEVTVTARVTDDLSGVRFAQLRYLSLAAPDQMINIIFNERNRIEGDALDGVYQATATLPQYSALGTWELELGFVMDRVGNLYRIQKSDAAIAQAFRNGILLEQSRNVWLPVIGR